MILPAQILHFRFEYQEVPVPIEALNQIFWTFDPESDCLYQFIVFVLSLGVLPSNGADVVPKNGLNYCYQRADFADRVERRPDR